MHAVAGRPIGVGDRHDTGITVGRCAGIHHSGDELPYAAPIHDRGEPDLHQARAARDELSRQLLRLAGKIRIAERRGHRPLRSHDTADVAQDCRPNRPQRAAERILGVDHIRATLDGGSCFCGIRHTDEQLHP
jgi:hypothetical protein